MVFQMNEDNPKLWNLMLNNINNVINELGKEHVNIKVVTYGPGINMFRKENSSRSRWTAMEADGRETCR